MELLQSTNMGYFNNNMHKFATWLNEWMLSMKRGLNKHYPLVFRLHKVFLQHLSETKGLNYILTDNIQSDPLEKHLRRYR